MNSRGTLRLMRIFFGAVVCIACVGGASIASGVTLEDCQAYENMDIAQKRKNAMKR